MCPLVKQMHEMPRAGLTLAPPFLVCLNLGINDANIISYPAVGVWTSVCEDTTRSIRTVVPRNHQTMKQADRATFVPQ